MDNAEEILVIILSTFLAIFIGLAIVLTINLMKLTKKLRSIAEHAEAAATNVEAASTMFKNAAGPLAAGKFIMNMADAVINKQKGRK